MEFILKKVVSASIMPLSIGIELIILALIFLYLNKTKRAKQIVIISILWLFLFSYSPFVNYLLYQLESTYPTLHQAPKDIRYIYLLGGGHKTDTTQPITSQINTISVVRLTEAIRLYNQLPKAKIILSGYSGLFDATSHAVMQKRLAISLGVNPSDLIVRPKPKDTIEEAIEAQKIVGKDRFIVVSSASHLNRAMRIFNSQNLHPIPAPTNHLASINNPNYLGIFSSMALYKSTVLFHEVLGLVWIWIR